MKKGFNGFPSWASWNVSLWLNNDEPLYRQMVRFCRNETRDNAAKKMLEWLNESGLHKTPDGARYTRTAIKSAMVGI